MIPEKPLSLFGKMRVNRAYLEHLKRQREHHTAVAQAINQALASSIANGDDDNTTELEAMAARAGVRTH